MAAYAFGYSGYHPPSANQFLCHAITTTAASGTNAGGAILSNGDLPPDSRRTADDLSPDRSGASCAAATSLAGQDEASSLSPSTGSSMMSIGSNNNNNKNNPSDKHSQDGGGGNRLSPGAISPMSCNYKNKNNDNNKVYAGDNHSGTSSPPPLVASTEAADNISNKNNNNNNIDNIESRHAHEYEVGGSSASCCTNGFCSSQYFPGMPPPPPPSTTTNGSGPGGGGMSEMYGAMAAAAAASVYPSNEQNPYASLSVDTTAALYAPLSGPYALKDGGGGGGGVPGPGGTTATGSCTEMGAWAAAGLQSTGSYYSYDPMTAYGYGTSYDLASRRKNATRESTTTLKAWLNEHKKNPYPTKGEKIMLAIITKMTLTQVSTWFANARRRLKKDNKVTWEPKNSKTEDEHDGDDGDGDGDDDDDDDDIPDALEDRHQRCAAKDDKMKMIVGDSAGGLLNRDVGVAATTHNGDVHHVKTEPGLIRTTAVGVNEDDHKVENSVYNNNSVAVPFGHAVSNLPPDLSPTAATTSYGIPYNRYQPYPTSLASYYHHRPQPLATHHPQEQSSATAMVYAAIPPSQTEIGAYSTPKNALAGHPECGVPLPASKPRIWSVADTCANKSPPLQPNSATTTNNNNNNTNNCYTPQTQLPNTMNGLDPHSVVAMDYHHLTPPQSYHSQPQPQPQPHPHPHPHPHLQHQHSPPVSTSKVLQPPIQSQSTMSMPMPAHNSPLNMMSNYVAASPYLRAPTAVEVSQVEASQVEVGGSTHHPPQPPPSHHMSLNTTIPPQHHGPWFNSPTGVEIGRPITPTPTPISSHHSYAPNPLTYQQQQHSQYRPSGYSEVQPDTPPQTPPNVKLLSGAGSSSYGTPPNAASLAGLLATGGAIPSYGNSFWSQQQPH